MALQPWWALGLLIADKALGRTTLSSVKNANKSELLSHSLIRVGQYSLTVLVEPSITRATAEPRSGGGGGGF